MAAMSAHPRLYNHNPGPPWGAPSQASTRNPSSSRNAYPMYNHPYASQSAYEEEEDTYRRESVSTPDVRVTAPSRAGEERRPDSMWDDDKSVYSERMSTTVTAPQTYYSSLFQSGTPSSHHLSAISSASELSRDSWQGSARPDSNVDPFSFMKYESPRQQLPKVVVSSPSENSFRMRSHYEENEANAEEYGDPIIPQPITPPPFQPPQGRVPSAVQGTRNFSRPNRAAISTPDLSSTTFDSYPRPPVPSSEEQKREVLERNQQRSRITQGSSPLSPASPSASFYSSHLPQPGASHSRDEASFNPYTASEYMTVPGTRSRSPSPSRSPRQEPEPPLSQSSSASSSGSSNFSPATPQGKGGLVVLPSSPPGVRVSAAESVYSTYSYYNLDNSPGSSPSTTTHFDQSKLATVGSNNSMPSASSPALTSPVSPGKKNKTHKNDDIPADPKIPDDFLALGIAHHEADRLKESADCFEKSATLNGGCAVGMLMWGLSLRHGWGVQKDETRAFKWLKNAAEHAVVDLREGKDRRDAVKKELVLAVYEVGQCFFQGWGVPKDKAMGVSYFQTAAQLGDPDAQQDLAFCLANGKGCKKDRKAAAKWYRAAAEQGASTVGLAWIYKPKYLD